MNGVRRENGRGKERSGECGWSWSHGIQAHSSTSLDNIDTPAANLIKKEKKKKKKK